MPRRSIRTFIRLRCSWNCPLRHQAALRLWRLKGFGLARAFERHPIGHDYVMGFIRKTLSVSTLGLVKWRSKSERLETAGLERDDALDRVDKLSRRQARSLRRAQKAEKKAEKAELEALSVSKKLKREKRRANRRAEKKTVAAADAAVRVGRRARRKARKQAKVTQSHARFGARKMDRKARKAVIEASGKVDQLTGP